MYQYLWREIFVLFRSCCWSKSPKQTDITDAALDEVEETFTHTPDTLCLLSWNIDGLDKNFTTERALAVATVIEQRKPELVYLQEIVNTTWEALTDRLGSRYLFYRDDEVSFHYYHILMIRKDSTVTPKGELEILKYSKSQQGRHLLQVPVTFQGLDIHLLTSHLESMNHYAVERKSQLKTTFSIMREMQDQGKFSVFAGDLNLLEKEVNSLPDNIVDAWEACGSEYEEKCTWDSTDPRFRLDRVYFSSPMENPRLTPTKFRLVGTKTLKDIRVHPSDHLGMWVEFTLQKPDQPSRIRVYSN